MIYAFTGKTGSGKTYKMVEMAYKYWRDGVDIYSNTILLFSKDISGFSISEKPGFFSSWEKIKWFIYKIAIKSRERRAGYEPRRGKIVYFTDINEIIEIKNGIILFDEAQVLFNARNWEALPYEFQYKLQQHRKHNLTLLCTCQNLGTIDITYRRLIHQWFHCEVSYKLGHEPVIFGIFRYQLKDIDMLFNNVDDLKVPVLAEKRFIIHKFKRRLYDTFYDIGFKSLKALCLMNYDQISRELRMKLVILPKKMSLSEELRSKSMINSQLGLTKSRYSAT